MTNTAEWRKQFVKFSLNVVVPLAAPLLGIPKPIADKLAPLLEKPIADRIDAAANDTDRQVEQALREHGADTWPDDEDTKLAVRNAMDIVHQYGTQDRFLTEAQLDPQRATQALLAMPDVQGALRTLDNEIQRHRCRVLIGVFYEQFLSNAGVLKKLEDDFRAAVLRDLQELPKQILAAEQDERRAAANILLDIPHKRWKPYMSQSVLLRADVQIVPFHGRAAELQELQDWCKSDLSFDVRLYTGPGGIGKTRLAIEACTRLMWSRWRAGFLRREAAEMQSWQFWDDLLDQPNPLLIVVDYAETRRSELLALFRAIERYLQRNDTPIPVRVLLLARSAQEWWEELKRDRSGAPDLLSGLRRPEHRLSPFGTHGDKSGADVQERERLYRAVVRQFTQTLSITATVPDRAPADLSASYFGQVLLLYMLALLEVQRAHLNLLEGAPGNPGEQHYYGDVELEILDEVLKRERGFWEVQLRRQVREGEGLRALSQGMGRAIALVALGRQVNSEADVVELLELIDVFRGQTAAVLQTIAEILRNSYPSSTKGLEPLQPDLLGEHLIQRELEGGGEYAAWLIEEAFGETVTVNGNPKQGLTVLTRLARRQPSAIEQLRQVLHGRLAWLALPVLEVAQETGGRIATLSAELLQNDPDPVAAAKFANQIPRSTVVLRQLAVVATQQALDAAENEQNVERIILLTIRLGNRLAEMGRREEALEVGQEAVQVYRELARGNPDAFLPDLATTLNTLSIRLAEMGRREEALEVGQEAVQVYRELARGNPDAFLPDLARSLNTLSNRLAEMGRREEALEPGQSAANVRRELARGNPDAFLPDLAESLNNFSIRLADVGRREGALEVGQEAVQVYRELARGNPDAFLPHLATSLNNFSIRLADVGRREEALEVGQEAVQVDRELARGNPDAFLPHLAGSLNTLSNRLAEMGRREEALEVIREAVQVDRELARGNPDAFLSHLATSLNTLSTNLAGMGRREEALEVIREAVQVDRDLAEDNPDAFLPDLARSLNNFSITLAAVGRREEALKAAQEATGLNVSISRQ